MAYQKKSNEVKFHENGKIYIWNIPARTVTNEQGGIISKSCYNLKQARAAVKNR